MSGGIPSGLEKLVLLERLNLAHNKLSGAIPYSFSNLTRMKILMLFSNKLSGEIPTLDLRRLTHLSLNGNKFNGSFPTFLSGLKGMRRLTLDDSFSGIVPDRVGVCKLNTVIRFKRILVYVR